MTQTISYTVEFEGEEDEHEALKEMLREEGALIAHEEEVVYR